ncbi:helix-turn-helix domain-containing protein [Limosilactobacillus pulli]|uniref:helix-turn-helix domain-containing protein n=1 Tax=Limosilactobacillus pulli TaxID=2991833 RepID=UPI0024BB199C|nr:helix-turn-helix transcriptional regulator [Limosilactobacillus pulli]
MKFYRQVSGLTQEKLAEKADLSVKFISMIESNPKRNISIQSLAKIAAALNIPLATLISKEDDLKDQRPYTKMLMDVLEKMPQEVSESFSMNFLEEYQDF